MFAKVDDADYDLVMRHTWHVNDGGYAVTNVKKADGTGYTTLAMHHLIVGKGVDHEDRDPRNNQRHNLRYATLSQNLANSGPRPSNSTGYKGVTYEKARNKYVAQINFNHRVRRIGRFNTAIEAAYAYNEEALKTWGKYAYLNPV